MIIIIFNACPKSFPVAGLKTVRGFLGRPNFILKQLAAQKCNSFFWPTSKGSLSHLHRSNQPVGTG